MNGLKPVTITLDADNTEPITLCSHTSTTILLKKVPVQTLEIEDLCFHVDSCVPMPDIPVGISANQGVKNKDQERVSGLKALSLVYRHLEQHPEQRIIIAGHTDTHGNPRDNFDLSRKCAEGIYYLLTGKAQEWAELVTNHHTIEDYQQIMKYFYFTRGWRCDPGNIDNTWNPRTASAVQAFFYHLTETYSLNPRLDSMKVKNSENKKFPIEVWQTIFTLYEHEIFSILIGSDFTPGLIKQARARISFVDNNYKYIGCGESFPLDQIGKDNYRSQQNRRVEILFLNKAKHPFMLRPCPLDQNKKHDEERCPIYNKFIYKRTYLQPDDIHTATYHIRFEYYDRITRTVKAVPEGLKLEVFKGGKPVFFDIRPLNRIYEVKVYNCPHGKREKDIHFRFWTENAWLYTSDLGADPKLVTRFSDIDPTLPEEYITREALARKTSYEQSQFNDLPEIWDSRNWLCSLDNTFDHIDNLITQPTTMDKPLTFRLDSIVLVDENNHQMLEDCNALGQKKPLDKDKSRFRLIYINNNSVADKQGMKVFTARPKDQLHHYQVEYSESYHLPTGNMVKDPSKFTFPLTSDQKSVKNFIIPPNESIRMVVFCSQFYDVTFKRTTEHSQFSFTEGHVLGARAAVLNDPEVHYHESFNYKNKQEYVNHPRTGHFELHYFHGGSCDIDRDYSYVMAYWSAVFTKDTDPTNGSRNKRAPKIKEIAEFLIVGMNNSMDLWNKKAYEFRVHNDDTDRMTIKPFFFFEANETFKFALPSGVAIDFEKDNYDIIVKRADFKTAMANTYGGKFKTIVFVTEDKKGSYFVSDFSSEGSYSLGCFGLSDRTFITSGDFANRFPHEEFGDGDYPGACAMAHEIGHALGQVDDYVDTIIKEDKKNDEYYHAPTFEQRGYDQNYNLVYGNKKNFITRVSGSDPWQVKHDLVSTMCYNGPLRMRYIWRYVYWINKNCGMNKTSGSLPLKKFLGERHFKLFYPNGNIDYYRPAGNQHDPYVFSRSATIKVSNGTEVDITTAKEKTVNIQIVTDLDETRFMRRSRWETSKPDITLKAILVVRVLIALEFIDNHRAPGKTSSQWNELEKFEYADDLYNQFFNDMYMGIDLTQDGKYYLTDTSPGPMNPTLIHFVPGIEMDINTDTIKNSNYHIKVIKNATTNLTRKNKVITVGQRYPEYAIFNYFFNKRNTDFRFSIKSPNDFAFLITWFRKIYGQGFQIEEL